MNEEELCEINIIDTKTNETRIEFVPGHWIFSENDGVYFFQLVERLHFLVKMGDTDQLDIEDNDFRYDEGGVSGWVSSELGIYTPTTGNEIHLNPDKLEKNSMTRRVIEMLDDCTDNDILKCQLKLIDTWQLFIRKNTQEAKFNSRI